MPLAMQHLVSQLLSSAVPDSQHNCFGLFYHWKWTNTDLNILLLKECMHHFGVKILELSPEGAEETFTTQRQQAFYDAKETPKNSY